MIKGRIYIIVLLGAIPIICGDSGPEEIFQANFRQKLKETRFSLVKFDGIQDSDPLTNATFMKIFQHTSEVKNISVYHVRFSGTQNVGLRKKLKMEEGKLPEIIIYNNDLTEISRYGSKLRVRELIDWIGSKTGLYMNRRGCTWDLDQLASGFTQFPKQRQYFFDSIMKSKDEKNKGRYLELINDFISSGKSSSSLLDFVSERLKSLRANYKAAQKESGPYEHSEEIMKNINVAKSFREQFRDKRLPVKAKLKNEL